MQSAPLLLCASPRTGNSLEAARLFAAGFNAAKAEAMPELKPSLLSAYRLLPCVDCGTCRQGKSCPLTERDDSAALLGAFVSAPLIAIAAPIYFYHIPAQLKALLDRCQQYYAWREKGFGGLEKLPRRKAFVMLSAAREQGSQTFNGALLSLKFALAPFNIDIKAPIMMRGLDDATDMAKRPDYHASLKAYGAQAAALLAKTGA